MLKRRIKMRDVTPDDAAAILEIYTPYIKNTAITFEERVPTLKEFTSRITKTIKDYPYIAAIDDDGKIIGYAYAGPLKTRDAFARSCELSIYFKKEFQRLGLGTELYLTLIEELRQQGIVSVYAAIAASSHPTKYLTRASIEFHEIIGFEEAGIFPGCAAKFGEWFDLVWMYMDLRDRANTEATSKLFIPRSKL